MSHYVGMAENALNELNTHQAERLNFIHDWHEQGAKIEDTDWARFANYAVRAIVFAILSLKEQK